MKNEFILRSQSLLEENLDESIIDLTIIPAENYADGYSRFITAGNTESRVDNIRVFVFYDESLRISLEKTIEHKEFTYSSIFIPSAKEVAWFDQTGRIHFYSLALKKTRSYQCYRFEPIWRGCIIDDDNIVVIQNPFTGGGFLTKVDITKIRRRRRRRRSKSSKILGAEVRFPIVHRNEIWCVRRLLSNENILVSAGGDGLDSDCAIYLWDVKKVNVFKKFKKKGHRDRIVYLNTFIDSKTFEEKIVSTSRDSRIVLWNLSGHTERILEGSGANGEGFYSLIFITNYTCIVGGEKGSLFFVDLKKRVVKNIKENEHKDKIDRIYWVDHTKSRMITVGRDGDIRLITLINQKCFDDEDERILFLVDNFFEKEIEFFSTKGNFMERIRILPYYLLW